MQDKHWMPYIPPIVIVLFFGRILWETTVPFYIVLAGVIAWGLCLLMLFWPKRKTKTKK
jgi:hypothetical protein